MTAHSEVYDDTNASELAAFDASHWWYRSKATLVAAALRRTERPGIERGWLVDVGGGSGGVTAMLGWPPARVIVVEGNAALAAEARRRHGLPTVRASVRDVPLADGLAAVVCLLDVVEHFDDPVPALAEAARLVAPGGRLVVNVPAHQWLWSAFDEQVGHARRYTRRALRADLAAVGFQPELLGHIFSWLVPPMWVTRRALSGGAAQVGHDQDSPAIDAAARALTAVERALLGRVSLPVGSSVLCVATRERR